MPVTDAVQRIPTKQKCISYHEKHWSINFPKWRMFISIEVSESSCWILLSQEKFENFTQVIQN